MEWQNEGQSKQLAARDLHLDRDIFDRLLLASAVHHTVPTAANLLIDVVVVHSDRARHHSTEGFPEPGGTTAVLQLEFRNNMCER